MMQHQHQQAHFGVALHYALVVVECDSEDTYTCIGASSMGSYLVVLLV